MTFPRNAEESDDVPTRGIRYYDFNVATQKKRIEKLRYLHRNPVTRGLVEKPEDWHWSSFRHYLTGEPGTVEIESEWTAEKRKNAGSQVKPEGAQPFASLKMAPGPRRCQPSLLSCTMKPFPLIAQIAALATCNTRLYEGTTEMARIIEFTIYGLAGRTVPFSAVLNRDVNVFFGLNGSGKTTLLKILHSALSTDTEILKDLPFKKAEVKVYLNRHRKSFVRSVTQEQRTEPSDTSSGNPQFQRMLFGVDEIPEIRTPHIYNAYSDALFRAVTGPKWTSDPPEPDGDTLTVHRGGFLPISRLYRNVATASGARRLSDQELDSAFARGLQSQWSEYYADISKEITKVQERGFANILGFFLSGEVERTTLSAMPDEAEASEAYSRITGFLKRQRGFGHLLRSKAEFAVIYAKRPELRNVAKQIETVEKEIDEISAPRERFRRVLESMFTGSKHLLFTEKEIQVELPDKKLIGLSLLSSGEKQLLFIALHALIGSNHSLIVDEPELSMHVDWQKRLVSTLHDLNPSVQQIMATHSPEIMADLSDDRIFRL